MPCNSIVTNRLDFATAQKNQGLLVKAIEAEFEVKASFDLGGVWQIAFVVEGQTIGLRNGQIVARGYRGEQWLGGIRDRLARAYSVEAVKEALRKTGFQLKTQAQQGDRIVLIAERRQF